MDVALTGVVKQYGALRALDGVSLQIPGGMFGLLGPNGAGKTTLLRLLTTALRPTAGEIRIGGIDALRHPDRVRRHLGYLPQEFGLYRSLTAWEVLDYIAVLKGVPAPQRRQQVAAVLEMVNLTGAARRRVGTFSGGMKQRLGIAQALLGDPALLVVDEPTAGLDPEERVRFRNLLARLAGQRTVLLSTHIVADVEASCSRLAILRQGRVAFCGTPAELLRLAAGRVWRLEATPQEAEALAARGAVTASRTLGSGLELRVLAAECPLGRGEPQEPTLEEAYLVVMGRAGGEARG